MNKEIDILNRRIKILEYQLDTVTSAYNLAMELIGDIPGLDDELRAKSAQDLFLQSIFNTPEVEEL